MAEPFALECEHVSFAYPSAQGSGPVVLRDVSFRVGAGKRLLVLGASGSGKSTLLRLLNRFDDPTDGVVRFFGEPLQSYDVLELRRRVSLVLQTPVAFEGTVRDNLLVGPGPAPDDRALGSLLDEVGLGRSFLARPARELSVGERQRMAIARSLRGRPEVILLDEPTSALDPHTTLRIAGLIDELQHKRRLTVVLVTHQPELVRRLDGHVVLLEAGMARENVAPADVERFLEGASSG